MTPTDISSDRRLMAKVRTIAAFSYKKSIGQPFIYPRNALSYCANFLHMMFAVPAEPIRRSTPEIDGRAQPAADPPRRPRAELLDVDGAHGRLVRRQPLRVDRRRASARCGARCTAAPTRRSSRCWSRSARRRRRREVRRARQGQELRLPADGLRPPRLQELRPARQDPQEAADRVSRELGVNDPLLDIAQQLEEIALERPVLHRAQALPERRLLQRHHLPRDGHPHEHVHGDVRARPPARLDRALEGDDGEPEDQDRPAAPDLHRRLSPLDQRA